MKIKIDKAFIPLLNSFGIFYEIFCILLCLIDRNRVLEIEYR